jgi:hypothetical protein
VNLRDELTPVEEPQPVHRRHASGSERHRIQACGQSPTQMLVEPRLHGASRDIAEHRALDTPDRWLARTHSPNNS